MKYYDILQADTAEDLALQVTEAIREGWVPQGGVAVGRVYSQAMIKA